MKVLKKIGFWIFILSIIFALLPVASVLVASGLSAIGGCNVNEGGAGICMLLGIDIGELLYTLFTAGWYAFMTIPIGAGAALFGLILFFVGKFAK